MLNKKKNKIIGTLERPRVVFCESNRFIRVQAIDDTQSNTIYFVTTQKLLKEKEFSAKNSSYTETLAKEFAAGLQKKGFKKIVFDKNKKIYHGKVKLFCETMRKMGIEF